MAKTIKRHTFKFGWDFERTQVDGVEANALQDQLFATQADYQQFGPINAGFFLLLTICGLTPQANQIKLRNNYDGLWVQDDWRVTRTLTLNGGVRCDYDSAFDKKDNVSPRIGLWVRVPPGRATPFWSNNGDMGAECTGHIGNNLGPNGLSSGSSTRVSISKYPRT